VLDKVELTHAMLATNRKICYFCPDGQKGNIKKLGLPKLFLYSLLICFCSLLEFPGLKVKEIQHIEKSKDRILSTRYSHFLYDNSMNVMELYNALGTNVPLLVKTRLTFFFHSSHLCQHITAITNSNISNSNPYHFRLSNSRRSFLSFMHFRSLWKNLLI